jgi:hypothetical protein
MWLFAFHAFLYRTARQAVIWAAVLLFSLVLAFTVANAQYGRPAKVSKGPRALGLLQLAANGKAHLIPITIMVDGKFYDAAAYKASPVPMALQPETVYEALRAGISQGIFTILYARNSNDNWIADGTWVPAGAAPAKSTHTAEASPVLGDNDAPPVLRRPSSEKPNSESKLPESKPPENKPAESKPAESKSQSAPPTSPPKVASGTATSAPPPAGDTPAPEDKDRPVLRRGIPTRTTQPKKVEAPAANQPPAAAAKAKSSGATGAVQLIPAVSDADGADPRPYAYDAKPEQMQEFRKKMLALAGVELRARARQIGPAAPESVAPARAATRSATAPKLQPSFEDVQLRVFDLSNSNEPILVLTANARLLRHSTEPASPELQNFITLVAHSDINGDLRKLFSSVTDTGHLDVIPRMELIDAVDADGDGRGDLLFRRISDAGSAFAIYRVTSDQLWPLFERTPSGP